MPNLTHWGPPNATRASHWDTGPGSHNKIVAKYHGQWQRREICNCRHVAGATRHHPLVLWRGCHPRPSLHLNLNPAKYLVLSLCRERRCNSACLGAATLQLPHGCTKVKRVFRGTTGLTTASPGEDQGPRARTRRHAHFRIRRRVLGSDSV